MHIEYPYKVGSLQSGASDGRQAGRQVTRARGIGWLEALSGHMLARQARPPRRSGLQRCQLAKVSRLGWTRRLEVPSGSRRSSSSSRVSLCHFH